MYLYYPTELYHFGIKGQKWGIRRFQNPDGTLTEEGMRRYGRSIERGGVLLDSGYTKGKVLANAAVRQGIYTVGSVISSALTSKYHTALNSITYNIGESFVNKADKLWKSTSISDRTLWTLGQHDKDFIKKIGPVGQKVSGALTELSKKASSKGIRNLNKAKSLGMIGSTLQSSSVLSEWLETANPYVRALDIANYGIKTAGNVADAIRDYRDIYNAEIARGIDKKRKKESRG